MLERSLVAVIKTQTLHDTRQPRAELPAQAESFRRNMIDDALLEGATIVGYFDDCPHCSRIVRSDFNMEVAISAFVGLMTHIVHTAAEGIQRILGSSLHPRCTETAARDALH